MFRLGGLKLLIYMVRPSSHRKYNIFPYSTPLPPNTPSPYEHSSSPSESSQNKLLGAFTNDSSTNCSFKDSPCTTDKFGTRNPEMQHWYRQKEKEWPFAWASSSGYFISTTDFHEKVSNKSIVHGTWRADPSRTLFYALFFEKKPVLRRILSPTGRFQDGNGQLWMAPWAG